MNERPTTTGFAREGFVETPKQREGFVEPAPVQAQAVPKMVPPPEPEPSPAELDAIQIPQDKWPIVVKLLYKPLAIPGIATYNELSFREPTGADIHRYGNPCRINADGEVLIEERKMHSIMSALCGIEQPFLGMLDPRDWNSCAWALRRFFAPDPRAWS